MDYRKFRFNCAVDWLELEVWTLNRHPAHRVWKSSAGSLSYVTGLDPDTGVAIKHVGAQGENTPTTRFIVRIQNPARFSEITKSLDTIQDRDHSIQVFVRGIEVAFDAYRMSSNTTDAELVEMTALMLHRISRPTKTNDTPRFYSWKGLTQRRYGWRNLIPAITTGQTAMLGNKGDDYVVRGYFKNYDTIKTEAQSKPKRVDLAANEHRARIEVRLQGKACPVSTLEDLANFRFQSLAQFFKFRRPADTADALEVLIRESIPSLGKLLNANGVATDRTQLKAFNDDEVVVKTSRPRKTITKTQADDLNEISRDQLRKLSLRWECEKGRERRRSDGNSGSNELLDGAKLPGLGSIANLFNPLPKLTFSENTQDSETTIASLPDKVALNTSHFGLYDTHQGSLVTISQCRENAPCTEYKERPEEEVLQAHDQEIVCTSKG